MVFEPSTAVLDLSTRICFTRYAMEVTLRGNEKLEEERDYLDALDELGEQYESLGSGGGRSIFRLPSETVTTEKEYVVKIAGPRSSNTDDEIPVSSGFVQNWREILVSRYAPMKEYIVPVVDWSPLGLWIVMPFAEQEGTKYDGERIDERAEEIEALQGIEPRMYGYTSSRPDIYWAENWGAYQGEYRLLDYGGLHLCHEVDHLDDEIEFTDPAANQPEID